MPAETKLRDVVDCKTPEGRLLATVEIFARPRKDARSAEQHPLLALSAQEASRYGKERLQLRERERYEYRLTPAPGMPDDLALLPARGVQPSAMDTARGQEGLIEPQDYCGLLPLVVVRRGDATQRPLASGSVEVRSVKLGYREHYRGMLSFIAEKCSALLLECRAPTKLRLDTMWRLNVRVLEQQLEFLRFVLESVQFTAAVNQVLHNPHRRMEERREERDISKPFKPDKGFVRQMAMAVRRVPAPGGYDFDSVPASINVRRKTDYLDTAENRFAKMVLVEFRDFLVDIMTHLARVSGDLERPEVERILRECARLRGILDGQLSRGFFPDVSSPSVLPLASPVLQRRAGYRELLRYWLQFHAGAQLSWDGGSEVFHAGARDVATLYEYWLFFQLEALFRQKFACDSPLHTVVVDSTKVPPQLVLKRGVELATPVSGIWSAVAARRLSAEFHFNRKFAGRVERTKAGSWSRAAQPDYTISIWPAEYTREEAEENELMVHVHFDAKYRVERVRELLGDQAGDEPLGTTTESANQTQTAAKYSDFLKMHAYRDAIRRTAGAYVLYPGNPGDDRTYQGFHEVLPGLGALAVRPDSEGSPQGIAAVSSFLDAVIAHLANRTTSRERVTYHIGDAYRLKEAAISYGDHELEEIDELFGREYRALPPAEHMVLVAWYRDPEQIELARGQAGVTFVRLGRRRGSLHVHPNISQVRHILLRTEEGMVADGLIVLREPGFRVYTRDDLRRHLSGMGARDVLRAWERTSRGVDDYIYALFQTASDLDWANCRWDGVRIMDEIERFESDRRNRPVVNLGRSSPEPRVLPMRDLLKALAR